MMADEDIDLCVEHALAQCRTVGIADIQKRDLNQCESLVRIRGNQVKVVSASDEQCGHRLSHALNWLRRTAVRLDLDCLLVLALGDLAGRQVIGPFSEPPIYTPYSRFCFSAIPSGLEIPIPDPNITAHFGWNSRTEDTRHSQKRPTACFAGSSTGRLNTSGMNQRIGFCRRCVGTAVVAKITYWYDLFAEDYLRERGVWKGQITVPYLSRREQMKHAILVDVDGNTNSWDRIPWGFASQSMVVHLRSEEECQEVAWYHPAIAARRLLPVVMAEEIIAGLTYDRDLSERQQQFSRGLLSPSAHERYLERVLARYNHIFQKQY